MKLQARHDAPLPVAHLFDAFADFEAHERAAVAAGATVTPLDQSPGLAPGRRWRVTFPFRGRLRKATLRLAALRRPELMELAGESPNLRFSSRTVFSALGPARTRVEMVIEIEAKTLPFRLLLQSARLARGRYERRMTRRLARFCERVAARG